MRSKRPVIASEITGIESITGAKTHGWFIGLPMTPKMLADPALLDFSYDQISACTDIAAGLGAKLIGLGAFSSVVGDGGITIAERSKIAVTTGNSYTVATAIQAATLACERVGIDPCGATLGVVGATGSIGKTCARVLASRFSRTLLVGRDPARTQAVADEIAGTEATTNVNRLQECDVVITVSSAGGAIVEPKHLRRGAIVVDVARPRDVSVKVARERPDVLAIEGGVVSVPGDVDFHFDFGFPAKTAYACMSETMMLALEDRPENFSLGKEIAVEQVTETLRLADRHGFRLAGFRSFEREVGEEAFARTRAARQ